MGHSGWASSVVMLIRISYMLKLQIEHEDVKASGQSNSAVPTTNIAMRPLFKLEPRPQVSSTFASLYLMHHLVSNIRNSNSYMESYVTNYLQSPSNIFIYHPPSTSSIIFTATTKLTLSITSHVSSIVYTNFSTSRLGSYLQSHRPTYLNPHMFVE